MSRRPRLLVSSQVADWHKSSIPIPSGGLTSSFPVAGLICQIDVTALSGLSNGNLLPSTMIDQSNNGNDGIRNGSPTYVTGATAAGKPAMRSGSGYYALNTAMWAGATAGHVFGYVKSDSPSGGVGGPWQLGGEFYSVYPWSDGMIYEGGLSASNQMRYTGTPSPGVRQAWRIYEIEHSETVRIIRIDGTQQASESKTFGPSNSPRILGSSLGANDLIMMTEFLAYNRTLSSAEAATVRQYLTTKYGATG